MEFFPPVFFLKLDFKTDFYHVHGRDGRGVPYIHAPACVFKRYVIPSKVEAATIFLVFVFVFVLFFGQEAQLLPSNSLLEYPSMVKFSLVKLPWIPHLITVRCLLFSRPNGPNVT